MSEQKVPRSVEQRIVIKFLVGENVPSAEIHHRLKQQYGEECLLLSQGRTAAAQCGLFTYKSVPVIFEPYCNTPLTAGMGKVKSQKFLGRLLCLPVKIIPNAPYYLIRYLFLSEGRAGRAWERSNQCSAGRGGTLDKTVLEHCVVCEGLRVTADAVHAYYRAAEG